MNKWFEEKLERNKLQKYTQRKLEPGYSDKFGNIFKRFSVTNWFILVNIIVFIFIYLFLIFSGEKIVFLFALQADSFFSGLVWQVLTSMFMHIKIWHLLANMVSLFFIGNFTERIIGRKRFFWLYILSGIFAGLFYVILAFLFGNSYFGERIFGSPETFAMGASGAIFSLLGLLAILTPYNRVYLITGPIVALIFQAVFASIYPSTAFSSFIGFLVTFYVIFSIISILSFNPRMIRLALPLEMPFWLLPVIAIIPLVIIGLFIPLPIGNTAHLGGLLAGLSYAYYLNKKYKRKTAMIRRYFK